MKNTIDIGVLISGGGTNLQAIIDACDDGRINGRIRFAGSDVQPLAQGTRIEVFEGVPAEDGWVLARNVETRAVGYVSEAHLAGRDDPIVATYWAEKKKAERRLRKKSRRRARRSRRRR